MNRFITGRIFRGPIYLLAGLLIVACGGGGGGGDSDWEPGVFPPSDRFAAKCSSPRSGIDPFTGFPYWDVSGSVVDENNFLRSYSDETYLWYDEITDRNPANYLNPLTYFDLLKTSEKTPSGRDRDRFHFTVPTDEWFQLSQGGVSVGYGATFILLSSVPPREVLVAYTEPDSPATAANLVRGSKILAIDGVDIDDNTTDGIDTLNAGLFPSSDGETYSFVVLDPGSFTSRTISMTAAEITSDPVQNVSVITTPSGDRVGYLLFNDYIATAEQELIDAVNQLNSAPGIDDLVVDLRYNGGGFLEIASEFAYMIAGDARTAGKPFETVEFNDKHPSVNPVTRQLIEPVPFYSASRGFLDLPVQPLPSLNLNRVFVLTGSGTCSASESVINSLRGVDVEVIQIGSTTCGKPYGFYPRDNCGTTYFTIQFRGVNARNFGDYVDGFSPANTILDPGEPVPGCSVADDFSAPLGDQAEDLLAAALAYRETPGSCPAPPVARFVTRPSVGTSAWPVETGLPIKHPWLQNRTLR